MGVMKTSTEYVIDGLGTTAEAVLWLDGEDWPGICLTVVDQGLAQANIIVDPRDLIRALNALIGDHKDKDVAE